MDEQIPDINYKTYHQKHAFKGENLFENITGLSNRQLKIKDNYLLN
jgi:hypothetical protein